MTMEMAGKTDAYALLSICQHPSMSVLRTEVRQAARSRSVVVFGETGTGKEIVAQAIHEQGEQKVGPFVAVNCANQNRDLAGSELFGHESGSFTGANGRHVGLVETASGGTLFLDEIGDLPIELQGRFLRVLETRSFTRVGGTTPVHSNFRVVAATNRNLKQMVKDRTFREDLYWRMSVFSVSVPPLRNRPDDILSLTTWFQQELSPGSSIIDEVARLLLGHTWPGNVRELRNVIERAFILADGKTIEARHISFDFAGPPEIEKGAIFDGIVRLAYEIGFWPTLDLVEQEIIRRGFAEVDSGTALADLLKIPVKTANIKLKSFGIRNRKVRRIMK